MLTLIGLNTSNEIMSYATTIEECDSGISAGGSVPNAINLTIATWLKKANLPA